MGRNVTIIELKILNQGKINWKIWVIDLNSYYQIDAVILIADPESLKVTRIAEF